MSADRALDPNAMITRRLPSSVAERKVAHMRRAVILCGTASFVMALLGGVLAFTLVSPSSATAQSTQPEEVRASVFTLVGSDGTVLARLAPSSSGAGLLQLYDAAGTRHVGIVGAGAVQAFDEDGTTLVFRAGRTFTVLSDGLPPLNGVELGPGGSVSMLPSP